MLIDAVRQMRDDGVKNAVAFATSAFGSYSGCRQYQENIAAALATVGAEDPGKPLPEISKIRPFSAHPLFIEAMADRVRAALAQLPSARIVFTAHSIPTTMSDASPYVQELLAASKRVADAVGVSDWKLAYQSRSGPPTQPWLEPDIADELKSNRADVVIAPIGFLSDHMEVKYDLDVEARHLCDELGIRMARAGTVETHPAMIRMIAELAEADPEKCPGCCAPMIRPR
jgi:ferrochelatase